MNLQPPLIWWFHFGVKMKRLAVIVFLLGSFVPHLAHATTCGVGYYVDDDGNCISCTPMYYCPGDNMRYGCPKHYFCPGGNNMPQECPMQASQADQQQIELDWYENTYGGNVISYMFSSYGVSGDVTSCYLDIVLQLDSGQHAFRQRYSLTSAHYNGWGTWGCSDTYLNPQPGYYLSGFVNSVCSTELGMYKHIYKCMNILPEHATWNKNTPPDNPICAWSCDSGYGRHGDECLPLCAAGMTKLNTSNGLSYNIYRDKITTPALNILRNNTVCYVNLESGTATGAINIQHGNMVYHVTD